MNRKRVILSAANKLYGKNVTQSEIARLLDLNGYCSKMSRNPEMRRCRKLRTYLIKVELEECLNVLYNELFTRKDINEG